MTRTNGNSLREAIRNMEAKKDTLCSKFEDSLTSFEGEKKTPPKELVNQIRSAMVDIATLREAQTYYNLQVRVSVENEEMSLAKAVKLVSTAGAIERMWKTAAGKRKRRYEEEEIRRRDEERAARTISYEDALGETLKAMRYASKLRTAIAKGNTSEVDIPFRIPKDDLDT